MSCPEWTALVLLLFYQARSGGIEWRWKMEGMYCSDFRYFKTTKNWDGIQYLVRLKEEGDPRFASFDLVDQYSIALCVTCGLGTYDDIENILRRTDDGKYVVPGMIVDFTRVLSLAIELSYTSQLEILLKMEDGKYVVPEMNNVDFTSVLLAAIDWDQRGFVKKLLRMNGGEYVLPGMNSVDFTLVLSTAIEWEEMDILKELLRVNGEEYVLPGMNSVNFTRVLSIAIEKKQRGLVEWLLRINEGGEYVLPGMNSVDFTRVLLADKMCLCRLLLGRSETNLWCKLKTLAHILPTIFIFCHCK